MKKILSLIMIVSLVLSGLIVGQVFIINPVSAPGPDLPDLTISQSNITFEPTPITVGEHVTINAIIQNTGNEDAMNVNVSFYEENILIGSKKIDLPIWHTVDVDLVNDATNGGSSIAVDSLGGIHISYFNYHLGDLMYAYKPKGGIWTTSTIAYSGQVGRGNSIVVDSENGIHISFIYSSNSDLGYAYKPPGGDWATSFVDSTEDEVTDETSIAVDSSNVVHITYYDNINDDLKYSYKPKGGNWTHNIIDSTDFVGAFSSIEIDEVDGIHVSYYDMTNQDLKYAYKPNGGSWTNYTVDSQGKVGQYTSIALDNLNGVHISYKDGTNSDLKYAYKSIGGSWVNYTVDSSGNLGYTGGSISVDGENNVHISGYDSLNKDLKYIYKPYGGSWTNRTIDYEDSVGEYSSITVDDDRSIHISYYDKTDDFLKYAIKSPDLIGIQTSMSWIPKTAGSRNITVKIDENNEIEELDETNNEATLGIMVEPGPLWNIKATPSPITLELNESQQFTAIGTDYFGNEVPISPTWEVDGGGLINQNGLFTAIIPGTWSISAVQENLNYTTPAIVTVEVNSSADTDSDDMPDWWEVKYSLNPFNASDANFDSDFDGLTNLQEFLNYSYPNTNDSDEDNLGDGFEVIFSKTNASNWDTNGNGIGDGLEFVANQGYAGGMQSLPDDWIGMTITWVNYTIYVKTNSSVLEGEFDKEDQKLKIKVTGPEGTQGTTIIDVPKSLCDPEDIEIKLDGELINYTLTQNATYFNIHIEYNHSTHELVASFGYINDNPDQQIGEGKGSTDNLFQIAFIIAAITAILLLFLLIGTRNEKQNNGIQELPPEKLMILLEKKYEDGNISDETYKDIKSTLEKYNGN